MAPLPPLTPATVTAIYQAYKDANQNWDSLGISVGELGHECDRYLWYSFRWCAEPEDVDGRKVRIFRRGDIEEERLVADLESIGVEVFGQQDRIRFVAGHVRGKIDGMANGVPEAPKTTHLCEFKSSNTKNFAALAKDGVKKAKPLHYVQLQLGMHAKGLERGLYLVCNKDDEALYAERVKYDPEFCARILARAERIIRNPEPPERISGKPDVPPCLFCKHRAVCHGNAFPRMTCRSCIHATPEMDGANGTWSCARWAKPISSDEQKDGCPAHLYIPALMPGEMVAANEEEETIEYRLRDGRTWVDGFPASADNPDSDVVASAD